MWLRTTPSRPWHCEGLIDCLELSLAWAVLESHEDVVEKPLCNKVNYFSFSSWVNILFFRTDFVLPTWTPKRMHDPCCTCAHGVITRIFHKYECSILRFHTFPYCYLLLAVFISAACRSFLTGPGKLSVGAESIQYKQPIECCNTLFEYAATLGYDFSILDIGGGYPESELSFKEGAPEILKYVTEFGVKYPRAQIIAEPGARGVYNYFIQDCILYPYWSSIASNQALSNPIWGLRGLQGEKMCPLPRGARRLVHKDL